MGTTINIHGAGNARADTFHPDNNMALVLQAGGVTVTYFGLPAELAWSMWDLMRDGRSSFSYGGQTVLWLEEDPQAAADLIARARAATLPVQNAEAA